MEFDEIEIIIQFSAALQIRKPNESTLSLF